MFGIDPSERCIYHGDPYLLTGHLAGSDLTRVERAHADLGEPCIHDPYRRRVSCGALVVLAIDHIEEQTYKRKHSEWDRRSSAR